MILRVLSIAEARQAPFAEELRGLTLPVGAMRAWFDRGRGLKGFVVTASEVPTGWNHEAIVGWLLAFVPPEQPPQRYYHANVFVAHDARQRGVGRALLHEAIAQVPEYLRVQVHDEASRGLFGSKEFAGRLIVDWIFGGVCRECGGRGEAIGLVDGERLELRPCGTCQFYRRG